MTEIEKEVREATESMNRFIKSLLLLPFSIAFAIFISLVLDLIWALPLKYSWNNVMPHILGLPVISYWQSFLLLAVLTMLWKITPINVTTKK